MVTTDMVRTCHQAGCTTTYPNVGRVHGTACLACVYAAATVRTSFDTRRTTMATACQTAAAAPTTS